MNFFQRFNDEFVCIDYGGIYEDLLTIDHCRYPSQVGIDLYTSSCAAYIFSHMARHDQSQKWLNAVHSSFEYHWKYFIYPRQRLEFNHSEFNFTPLHLAFGEQISNQFRGWTDYDPVNVFGLRWDNIAQEKIPSNLKKFIIWLEIYRNQKVEGLISDNHMGRATDTADLGYHQYCLAGLSFGNSILNSKYIDNIIKKGLAFSISLHLPNGEVGYYGRGANSNYHLASYIVSLSYAKFKFGWDTASNIDRALNYLNDLIINKTDQEGHSPSGPALNASIQSLMMGWHGSGSQYGALSAFLLARSRSFLLKAQLNQEKIKSPPIFENQKRTKHYKITDDDTSSNVVLSFTSGGDLIEWNLGQHQSGYAGLTTLSIFGQNRLLTNETINDNDKTYFLQDIQGQTKSSRSKMLCQDKACIIKTTDGISTITTRYQIGDGYWRVNQHHSDSSIIYALSLMDLNQVTTIDDRSVMLIFMDGVKLKIESDQKLTYDSREIKRSCQGPGKTVYFFSPSNMINLKFTVYPFVKV